MIHFGHPKSITNNQKPYSDDKWHTLNEKHNLDKMLSILDSEFNDEFYSKKMRLNLLDEAPPLWFKCFLEKWIQNGSVEDVDFINMFLSYHNQFHNFFTCGLVAIRRLMHIVEYLLYIVSFFSSILVSLGSWWIQLCYLVFHF